MFPQVLSRMVQTLVRTERSHTALRALLETLYKHADSLVASAPERPAHACAAGCAWCCYLPVDVTVPEALGIVLALRTSLTAEQLHEFQQRLAARVEQLRTLTFVEHTRARIPCILLHNNTCTVYPYRPLACRAWLSTSARRCETVFHGDPHTMLPPLDMETYSAVWSSARVLQDSLQRHRLEQSTYELHSVLWQLLQTPEPLASWLQGVSPDSTPGAFGTP